ncbi:MAG: hypothetical protein J7K98_02190, partial [Candidatus Aenigmarchaeota archaeon]|nr:hypothetical protein [Candidatus Aenigmarchaeota archaeon]
MRRRIRLAFIFVLLIMPSFVVSIDIPSDRFLVFDFQPTDSPVYTNAIPVNETLLYSPSIGYGWNSVVLGSRDGGVGNELERDLVFDSNDRYFYVDLPDGRYLLEIGLGDMNYSHDCMYVDVEAGPWDVYNASTSAGEIKWYNVTTVVDDGQLDVLFRDTGCSNPHWSVVGIKIKAIPFTVCSSGCDYTSIQDAINNVCDGCTVVVKDGTYHENILINKNITLIGEDPSTTVIEGDGTANTIEIQALNVRIEGFTIKGGNKYNINFDWLGHSSNITLKNNIIEENVGSVGDFGVRIIQDDPDADVKVEIEGNIFRHNKGDSVYISD